ncbi:MAG: aspartate carbamoyltransferase [Acidimicrobiia bacterium]
MSPPDLLVRARLICLAAAAIIAVAGCDGAGSTAGTDRQGRVEARGAQVMPFDQQRTTHIFRATTTGGVQTVVAQDGHDTKQIALVRGHLRDEARRFASGDFSDPMAIHGMKMPGLDQLRRHAARVRVEYSSVARGGHTYQTADPILVGALHEWFDAQLMDHGTNAHG